MRTLQSSALPSSASLFFLLLSFVEGRNGFGAEGDWVHMKKIMPNGYVCNITSVPLQIDGKLDEESWKAAPWTEDFVDIEGARKPAPRFRTRAKMLWDKENFYIAAELSEPHLQGTITEHDAVIFQDNDFEVFIDPDSDNHDYYELELNTLNTTWDLFLPRPYKDGGGYQASVVVSTDEKSHELWNVRQDSKIWMSTESGLIQEALHRAGENLAQLRRALDSSPIEHREAMEFLIANMPERDLRTLTLEFLLEEVRLAYLAWDESPWKHDIPKEVFLNNVLPYANINERRDSWRKDFRERFLPLIAGAKTPAQAAARLNQKLFPLLNVRYSTKRPKADQSPYESINSGTASCTGLSILLIDACRALGIPARFVGTPLWLDKSGNHWWVEIWDHGERIRTSRAEEMSARVLALGELKMRFTYEVFGEKPSTGRSMFISMHGGGGAPTKVNDQQWENQKKLYRLEEGICVVPRAPTDTWDLWHQSHVDHLWQFVALSRNCASMHWTHSNHTLRTR